MVDYSRLLLQPADVSDDEDTFTEQSSTPSGPDGLPGASALYVNQDDTRAIADTIVIYPDAETAAATLRDALPGLGSTLTDATSRPAPVGTDGTMAVGMSKDGSKAVTLLLFTEGPGVGAPGVPKRTGRCHHGRVRHQHRQDAADRAEDRAAAERLAPQPLHGTGRHTKGEALRAAGGLGERTVLARLQRRLVADTHRPAGVHPAVDAQGTGCARTATALVMRRSTSNPGCARLGTTHRMVGIVTSSTTSPSERRPLRSSATRAARLLD